MSGDVNDSTTGQFVDTNVLVYAHDVSAGMKHTRARRLLQTLWKSKQGCMNIQVLQEFYANITRKVTAPLSAAETVRIIQELAAWKIHTPEVNDILEAIRVQQRYHLSFWDAMIVWSAARLGCAILWSEDLNHGQIYEGVQVQNPFVDDSLQ
ncbi:MAG TPA: PIN domain-containing protein [Anaerolineae bacterium]|nr:PIN domain-containing protein [Anaerolineae bacterium]HQI83936.1 PIN domain-containing protein [Anaerolineae bacterium]